VVFIATDTFKNVFYTLAISAVTAIIGIVTDVEFLRITLIGVLSGVLFLGMWLWLSYEVGAEPSRVGRIALISYWIILPVVVLLCDMLMRIAGAHRAAVSNVRWFLGSLLFSSNYPVSWFCHRVLRINLWWGAGFTLLLVITVGLAGMRRAVRKSAPDAPAPTGQ
jgi:hypothetical protein